VPDSSHHAILAVMIAAPVLSVGLAAWVPPLWAGLKNEDAPALRQRLLTIAAGCAATAALSITFFGISPTDAQGTATGPLPWLGLLLLLGAMAVGVTVAVWQRNAGRAAARRRQFAQLPAVQQALANRQTRQYYRELIAQDPSLAREMRVGRPDIPRGFTDGGLLDLNAMPAEALITMANLRPDQARQVIVTREHLGRLSSVDDLVVHAGLEPHTAEELREQAVFL